MEIYIEYKRAFVSEIKFVTSYFCIMLLDMNTCISPRAFERHADTCTGN